MKYLAGFNEQTTTTVPFVQLSQTTATSQTPMTLVSLHNTSTCRRIRQTVWTWLSFVEHSSLARSLAQPSTDQYRISAILLTSTDIVLGNGRTPNLQL